MPDTSHSYMFSAVLSLKATSGEIRRSDGETVTLNAADVSALLLEMAVDDAGRIGQSAHHHDVLARQFHSVRRTAGAIIYLQR